jgi:hypothetical protein
MYVCRNVHNKYLFKAKHVPDVSGWFDTPDSELNFWVNPPYVDAPEGVIQSLSVESSF